MANEIAIPLLPCHSIDEMADFYTMLGFRRIYYQVRPNPYVLLKREDLASAVSAPRSGRPPSRHPAPASRPPRSRRRPGPG